MELVKKRSGNLDAGSFLEYPWCPLFGKLPAINGSFNAIAYKCIQIINQARCFWEVYDRPQHITSSWPHHGEVGYPEIYLTSARRIFNRAFTICSNAQMPPPLYEESKESKLGPDQSEYRWLILHAKDTIGVDREAEDHKIFAALSIRYAYWGLRLIIENWTLENDREALSCLQIASSFLYRSLEVDFANSMDRMYPDFELGKRRREQLSEFARRPRVVETDHEIWIREAEKLRSKHLGKSVRNIADIIRKKQKKPPRTLQNIYKVLLRNL